MSVSVLQAMERRNLKPTVQTYGNIVNMLCNDGFIDRALDVLEVIIIKKTLHDLFMCNSIVLALCKHQRIDDER